MWQSEAEREHMADTYRQEEPMTPEEWAHDLLAYRTDHRLIDAVSDAWSGEIGDEPHDICRLLAEFGHAMKVADARLIGESQQKIYGWIQEAAKCFHSWLASR